MRDEVALAYGTRVYRPAVLRIGGGVVPGAPARNADGEIVASTSIHAYGVPAMPCLSQKAVRRPRPGHWPLCYALVARNVAKKELLSNPEPRAAMA